jgi:hypothetical protein
MLVLLMGGIYEVRCYDGLRRQGIHTKFHDDWFRYSSTINVITTTILVAVMLVLLMGGIYDVRRWYEIRWHYIYTKFHTNWLRHSEAVRRGNTHRHTDSKVISWAYSYFLRIREVGRNCGRKRSWPNFKINGTSLDGLGKTAKNLRQRGRCQGFGPGTYRYINLRSI